MGGKGKSSDLQSDEWSVEGKKLVAQYVRMSTEHQKYSTDNQVEAIADYADRNAMVVTRTYMDAGKSGLTLKGRPGLQQLLADVQQGDPGYSAVLVYDISRWGRFPDPDEAAVYEQLCKRKGISVIYCAEPFKNDGSLSSTVLVGLKRSMAAEYSRELSVKVFAGHKNLVRRGYRQGGMPGLGLRRQLIDEHHNVKGVLQRGEKKSIQTDRVLLIPGPDGELSTVRSIYRMFLQEGKPERVIASELNRQGIRTDLDRTWTRGTVHQVLTNEKYIGNNVYNRTSFKLKIEHADNPPDEWIRKDDAFQAIVSKDVFAEVQAIIARRTEHMDDARMLELLRGLHLRHGILSGVLIDEEDGLPSSSSYRSRFGSLYQAYKLVGYDPKRDYAYIEINRALRRYHPEIVASVRNGISAAGGYVSVDAETDTLLVNAEFTASVVVARCKVLPCGRRRWLMRFDASLAPDVTIVARMNASNTEPLDYYVFPALDFSPSQLPSSENNSLSIEFYRFSKLDEFYALCSRIQLAEAA